MQLPSMLVLGFGQGHVMLYPKVCFLRLVQGTRIWVLWLAEAAM